jgi:hypothetical protein
VKTSAGASSETTNRESDSPDKNGRGPAKTQGGARASSSGRLVTQKVVRRSRNRGCKGHRILRRVPADGRHPGSAKASSFTRRCGKWPWRLAHRSNPRARPKGSSHGEPAKAGYRRGKSERRQGCQRLDRSCTVGRKRPRSCSRRPRGRGVRGDCPNEGNRVFAVDPPKRSRAS